MFVKHYVPRQAMVSDGPGQDCHHDVWKVKVGDSGINIKLDVYTESQ